MLKQPFFVCAFLFLFNLRETAYKFRCTLFIIRRITKLENDLRLTPKIRKKPHIKLLVTQLKFTCSKWTREAVEADAKFAQS